MRRASSEPPLGIEYDPFADAVIDDPYPWYRWLRDEAPVYHNAHRDVWVLSRHADVKLAARSHHVLSSASGVSYAPVQLPMMLTMDPPEHDRLRSIVARRFTPRAVGRLRSLVGPIVDDCVTSLGRGEVVDAVEALTAPLPVRVIAAILGVSGHDAALFKRWSDDIVAAFDLPDLTTADSVALARVTSALQEMRAYVADVVAAKRHRPGDDLLSLLAQPTEHGALDDDEIFWFFHLLLVAGNETTTNLIGNLLVTLTESPWLWDRLRAEPGLVPAVVEEALRHGPPIQGFFRQATAPVELPGGTVPDGARVLLLFASANRDERVFSDPDRFDPRRDAREHLAFGHGVHVCLGAHLARLETAMVLEALVARAREIRRAGPPVRTRNPIMRGVTALPLEIVPG